MSYNDRKFVDLNPSSPALRKILACMEYDDNGKLKDTERLDNAIQEAIEEVGKSVGKYRNVETDLSQTDVGRLVRKGQSRIGNLEVGMGNPTLRTIILIKAVLEEEMLNKDGDCEQLMTHWKHIAWVCNRTTLREAVLIMREKGYSQMPVCDFITPPDRTRPVGKRNFLGFLNESALLREDVSIANGTVGQIILTKADCLVDPSWTFNNLRDKLKGNKEAVLVVKSDEIIGIITKSDLLREEYMTAPKEKEDD